MKTFDKSIQISLVRTLKWIVASDGTEHKMKKITLKGQAGGAQLNACLNSFKFTWRLYPQASIIKVKLNCIPSDWLNNLVLRKVKCKK